MYEKRNRQEKQGQLHMFCIDDLVPKNHILRDIDKAIDFSFIYDEVEGMYSDFDGEEMRIEQSGGYPFGETVYFDIQLKDKAKNTLKLRIPYW